MTRHETTPFLGAGTDAGARPRILIVDDSPAQRMLMAAQLRRFGFDVLEADCAERALEVCRSQEIRLILSDWVMPGMCGPELCHRVKSDPDLSYAYFILLTSKSERADIAHGLDRGADDFLTKPVNGDELRARLKAGMRVIAMQHELSEKNRLIGQTLSELQGLYGKIEEDLLEAQKLQEALVRERFRDFGTGQVSLLLRSSGHVGGDLVGFFRASASQVGLYSIDVSGHGISSALMTARLAGHLNTASPRQNIALSHTAGDFYRVLPPDEVVRRFNELMSTVISTDLYFTIAYAIVDLDSGMVDFCQAGHPHPVVQRVDGAVELHGQGGLPVGLIEEADYAPVRLKLCPGDRLLLASDGITECPGRSGGQLEDAGFQDMLAARKALAGPALLDGLVTDLESFSGVSEFPDDVSVAMFEFRGAEPGR
ncbi:fused response regulator/phosphatase [Fluviibacterium sp. DFM31]|uniref:Fused response regulator/phosphatase n=1 Tax=Meridianimarinicoccus marinus TaxID=3231483 RepID=A0ABV3L8S0_9RHOB